MKIRNALSIAALALSLPLAAQQAAPIPQYGPNVTLDQARKNGWPMAIAVVDNAGMLVTFQRIDNTQTASVQVAMDKAVSSAIYRRLSKAFQDGVAGGGAGLRLLNLRGASTVEGGLPLYVDGKIVGGIGVSGMAADQDGVVAKAGADALK